MPNKDCRKKVDGLLLEEVYKKRLIMKQTLKDLKKVVEEYTKDKKLAS